MARLGPDIKPKYAEFMNDSDISPLTRLQITNGADAKGDNDGVTNQAELQSYLAEVKDQVRIQPELKWPDGSVGTRPASSPLSAAMMFGNPTIHVYLQRHGISDADLSQVPDKIREFSVQGQARLDAAKTPSERNMGITAAYAEIYVKHPELKWAGMAAYGSEHVGVGIRCIQHVLHGTPVLKTDREDPMYAMLKVLEPFLEEETRFPLPGDRVSLRGILEEIETALIAGNNAIYDEAYPYLKAYDEMGPEAFEKWMQDNKNDVPEKMFNGYSFILQGLKLKKSPETQQLGEDLIWRGNGELLWQEQSETAQKIVYDAYDRLFALASPTVNGAFSLKEPLRTSSPFYASVPGGQLNKLSDRWEWMSTTLMEDWKSVSSSEEEQIRLRREMIYFIARYKTSITD